jgi:hypothetical protein
LSEPQPEPPIPQELLNAVHRIDDAQLREDLETHLRGLITSMRDLGALLKRESWADAVSTLFRMDDARVRQLAAATLAVVAQQMKNTPGEFERWMRG